MGKVEISTNNQACPHPTIFGNLILHPNIFEDKFLLATAPSTAPSPPLPSLHLILAQ